MAQGSENSGGDHAVELKNLPDGKPLNDEQREFVLAEAPGPKLGFAYFLVHRPRWLGVLFILLLLSPVLGVWIDRIMLEQAAEKAIGGVVAIPLFTFFGAIVSIVTLV